MVSVSCAPAEAAADADADAEADEAEADADADAEDEPPEDEHPTSPAIESAPAAPTKLLRDTNLCAISIPFSHSLVSVMYYEYVTFKV